MDPAADEAIRDYHALLRDEKALAQELEEGFFGRMREANLTFGGRMLCSFPRPNFVSPPVYDQIRGVCRGIFRAIEKVEATLGRDLWDRVDLTAEQRALVALRPFDTQKGLLETLLACYGEGGGGKECPTIAIVDYDDVPTRPEHHMAREFFASRGHFALVCDPRQLTYEGGVLRWQGQAVDIVYKRLLVNELLERIRELPALVQAVKDRAVVLL